MGTHAADQNVSAVQEGVMAKMRSSGSSTALSITAAIGGLLVLLTLLVGGPIACVCYVALQVKRLRTKAKSARSLIFAAQWRAQNPFQPLQEPMIEDLCHGQVAANEEDEAAAEEEKGTICNWPYFLHTAIPDDFNGVSTAFFQSPPPIIIRSQPGALEFIRFNPGIGHKRQEQSVQCSRPLLAGCPPAGSDSLSYFEITIVGFNREKNIRRLGFAMPEAQANANIQAPHPTKEKTKTDIGRIHSIDEKTKDNTNWLQNRTSNDLNLQMVSIEGTLAIGLAAWPAPPFRLPGRDTISVAMHSKSGRLFINDMHDGQPFAAPPGWGKVGVTVGCGYDTATHMVYFTIGGACWNTNFAMPMATPICNGGIDNDQYEAAAHPLFPTIGADCDVSILVNLGQESFKFKPKQ